jgi:integrase
LAPGKGFTPTTTAIKAAKPKDKPYRLAIGRGLTLLVHPNGSKYWQFRYRRLGKEQIVSLGPWGTTKDMVSLDEALGLRETIRAKIRQGIDPAEERRAQKRAQAERTGATVTFERVALQWLEVWRRGKSERTVDYQKRRLENDIFPLIGSKHIEMIERKDVIAVVRSIDSRGAHEMASRAINVISRILGYAVNHELRETNPAQGIKPSDLIGSVPTKNFASIDPKELPTLLAKIDRYEGLATRYAMQLLALTFVRTKELIQATWPEIDLKAKRWIIPAARMKKAKGIQITHIVPLSDQAIAVLEKLKPLADESHYLFPGSDPKRPISNNTILMALARMGYRGRMTGHGFRSIASTILHEQGFNHLYIERQLSHLERDEVAAAYNYAEYLEQRGVMMQWWADHLDSIRKPLTGVKNAP